VKAQSDHFETKCDWHSESQHGPTSLWRAALNALLLLPLYHFTSFLPPSFSIKQPTYFEHHTRLSSLSSHHQDIHSIRSFSFLPIHPPSDENTMSDNHQAHGSDNEQAAPVTPTMKRALAFIDLQASVESSSAEGSSATSLPTETTTASSPSAIPASNTQQRSAYVWPQPRRRPAPAAQTIDSGIRRTPAGIRALSVATQSSTCILHPDVTT
jgi:hypothetical protein